MADRTVNYTVTGHLPDPVVCLTCDTPMGFVAEKARFYCRSDPTRHPSRMFTNWPGTPPIAEFQP